MANFLETIAIYDEDKNSMGMMDINLTEGTGLWGDIHYDDDTNQVAILFYNNGSDEDKEGLCTDRFKANLYIESDAGDIDGDLGLEVGKKIVIGDAVLTITNLKNCYPECKLVQNNENCHLKYNACFAEVKTGGNIMVGSPVEIES